MLPNYLPFFKQAAYFYATMSFLFLRCSAFDAGLKGFPPEALRDVMDELATESAPKHYAASVPLERRDDGEHSVTKSPHKTCDNFRGVGFQDCRELSRLVMFFCCEIKQRYHQLPYPATALELHCFCVF